MFTIRLTRWRSGRADDMEVASDTTSSSPTSQDPMVDLHELNGEGSSHKGRFVRLWKVPVPVRKGNVWSDSFKTFAILVTMVCIAQTIFIYYLRAGLVRVPNDPYDNTFWKAEWHAPSIWTKERQNFLHNALPVPVHSHNDYWRAIPLHEALASGCISIEADVHLEDNDLLIGHSHPGGKDETLRSMYLEPLLRMLDAQNANTQPGEWNGIFNQSPHQTVVLLIDIKSAAAPTFAAITAQLQPLRDRNYLTYWNGTDRITRPLTIVVSGNIGYDGPSLDMLPHSEFMTINTTHRDIFLDAPLESLLVLYDDYNADPPSYYFNASNSYYASTRFSNARLHQGWTYRNETYEYDESPYGRDMWASQLEQARRRGLISRYWDTPSHPPNVREIVWRVLVELEVGVLNMDDMGAVRARARGWGKL